MNTYTRFTAKAPNAHAILLGTAESAINDPKYIATWTAKQIKAATKRVEEMRRVGRENGWND